MADSLRSEDYRALVRALRAVRERLGIEQGDLSHRLGRPRNFINRIEAAERRLGFTDLIAIAREMDVDPTELFDEITRELRHSVVHRSG